MFNKVYLSTVLYTYQHRQFPLGIPSCVLFFTVLYELTNIDSFPQVSPPVYCYLLFCMSLPTQTVSPRYPLLCTVISNSPSVSATVYSGCLNDIQHHLMWNGWFDNSFPPEKKQACKLNPLHTLKSSKHALQYLDHST